LTFFALSAPIGTAFRLGSSTAIQRKHNSEATNKTCLDGS
jgi:hypothetical protein